MEKLCEIMMKLIKSEISGIAAEKLDEKLGFTAENVYNQVKAMF